MNLTHQCPKDTNGNVKLVGTMWTNVTLVIHVSLANVVGNMIKVSIMFVQVVKDSSQLRIAVTLATLVSVSGLLLSRGVAKLGKASALGKEELQLLTTKPKTRKHNCLMVLILDRATRMSFQHPTLVEALRRPQGPTETMFMTRMKDHRYQAGILRR